MEQCSCLVCGSDTAEEEHHFVFDCSAYCLNRDRLFPFSGDQPLTLFSFFILPGSLPRVCMNVLHTGLEC